MGRDERLERNAQALERALAETRRHLREVDGRDERARRASAIEQVAQYVALLREAGAGRSHPPVSFWFKREFPDGRWDVAERVLDAPPRLGDLVAFEDGSCWQVRDSQLVRPRPERKPAREFFVCALAA
jgi:hypothetical protein